MILCRSIDIVHSNTNATLDRLDPHMPHKSSMILLDAWSHPASARICKMVFISDFSRYLLILLASVSSAVAQGSNCGTLGNHNELSYPNYMGNYFYHGLTSFALCTIYCQRDARCEAFRYSYWSDADSQYCEFFNDRVDM